MKQKKVLITGGNGYLGRHLAKAIQAKDAEVYIMDIGDKSPFENYIQADITDGEKLNTLLQGKHFDIIYHLAATLNRKREFDDFESIQKINLMGTYNLLHALKDVNYDNFIFTSTSEIYGSNTPPFHEEQLPNPASPYSLTKVFSEELIRNFSETYHKKYTILRIFNFFGKNMSPQFFIPQMIKALQNNETFKMTKGEQKRDFLYLSDLINALEICGQKTAANDTYNVCSGKAISLEALVLNVKKVLNSSSDIKFGALPYRNNEVWNMVGDNQKFVRNFGFQIQYDLEHGLKEIIG